ncbi:MAG TPA: type IX secretion system membrane protein PorP/SprF [Mariprofundaceae bacterium]|nr:type IX secretion system membrane protein PorP/SprF [Mariprofundaceae bacterium]
MNSKYIMSGLMIPLLGFSVASQAAEFAPSSVRALSMGGSSVASTHGVDASYWNPAAYGFFGEEASEADNHKMSDKDFGVELGIGVGANVFGPLDANRLKLEALPDPSAISSTGGLDAAGIQAAASVIGGLSSLDPAPLGANVFINGAIGARVSNYGLGVRTAVDLNSTISVDNVNVGFADIFAAFTGQPLPSSLTPQYFSATQVAEMEASLVANAGLTAPEANLVVATYDATLAADTNAVGQEQQNTDAMNTIANAAGTDLANNNTALSVRGVAISEVGFTYGYAINERLSVGGVLKLMQADIIAADTKLFSTNSGISFDQNNTETSTAFGLDLGVMYRIPSWQIGLTVKNINTPSFEHSGAGTFANVPYLYELKPQAKFGAAWIPTDTVSVELGYDLTENEGAVASSKSQYWNIGAEWNAWNVLALRLGAFENMSQDIGLVTTAGLGLNLWAARIDLGVAVSSSEVEFDGEKVPAYAAAALAIAVDF